MPSASRPVARRSAPANSGLRPPPPSAAAPLGHFDLIPVPAVPRALPPRPAPVAREIADALRLLGASIDPRLRAALVASTPPTEPSVEHYLRLALALTEALRAMPGVLPLDAPEHRLELWKGTSTRQRSISVGSAGERSRSGTSRRSRRRFSPRETSAVRSQI